MTTTANLIDQTLLEVLSGQREQRNRLTSAVGATDTTFTFDFDLGAIQQGAVLGIGLELVYVWNVSGGSRSVEIERAYAGSVAAAYPAGEAVQVNPRFSRFAVLNAINSTLKSLSSPAAGLFQMRDITLTSSPVLRTYDLVGATNVIDVYAVEYDLTGTDRTWPSVKSFRLLRDMPLGDYPSSVALKLYEDVQPGRRLLVHYKGGFDPLVNLTDDVELTSGLHEDAFDLVPLGAQMRMMNRREAKRTFTEAQGDTRRAGEVNVGSATRGYSTLRAEWDRRLGEERSRLQRLWPPRRLT